MEENPEIKSNTCEIIKVPELFVKECKELKQEYLNVKQKIFNEIVDELSDELKKENKSL